MNHHTKFAQNPPNGGLWYLQLLADALVIVTFCGLAVALATSFAVAG